MKFSYNNVLIFGYGKSGKSCEKLFTKYHINYHIFDDNLKLSGGKYLSKITKRVLQNFDLIVLSPGISIYDPRIKLAQKMNIKVIGELELGYYFCDVPIIAVTGTDGKTTTVNMLYKVLKSFNLNVAMLGNCGTPFSSIIEYKNLDYVVVEVSSFMLESIDMFKPYIGVILNIDADHLDRHKSLENYINAKLKLFANSSVTDYAVLNKQDLNITTQIERICANITYFNDTNGIYIDNMSVFDNNKIIVPDVAKLCASKVFYDDILAVLSVCKILGLDLAKCCDNLSKFKYLKNRAQVVACKDGITYINDSKATNFHACKCCINSIEHDIVLILGGQTKGLDFKKFILDLPQKVKKIQLIGKHLGKYVGFIKKTGRVCNHSNKFDQGIINASQMATKGEVVLFSPGFSSFDMFSDYAQRGQKFCEIVKTRIIK